MSSGLWAALWAEPWAGPWAGMSSEPGCAARNHNLRNVCPWGWCVGARNQKESDLKKGLNKIEKEHDSKLQWRKTVNRYLKNQYKNLFNKIDKLVYLKAPNFNRIFKWRLLQEEKLKLTSKNKKTMSKYKVREFIMFYERITKNMMKDFPQISDLTIFLDKKHRSTKMIFHK